MTTRTPEAPLTPGVLARGGDRRATDERWVTFAVTMLAVAGTLNCIGGIAAAGDSHFFAGAARYMVGDLSSLGWVVLLLGIVQVLAAVGVRARSFAAVWIGVICAAANLVVQLLMIQAQPFWSLAIGAVDVLVIHALTAYAEPETDR
jgi:hypothetical protein